MTHAIREQEALGAFTEEGEGGAREEKRAARALLWMRRRPKASVGLCIVALFYLSAIFADFLAPYDYRSQSRRELLAPATTVRFRDEQGAWHARPFIYARRVVDPLERRYSEDTSRRYHLAFFTRGHTYKLLGIFPTDIHLFGLQADGADAAAPRIHLLGTDSLGRDRLSRLLVASRFSLVVGPLGTLLASLLGVLLGCVAGYSGRLVDSVLMRAADAMMSLPVLVLILAARAAFPLELPRSRATLLLVTIFVAVGWAEMARLTRGLVVALREREFVLAARAIGLTRTRILFRHILPNAAAPLIVQATILLPAFLLAETSLSFLGVGLQEPEASWGNMLTAASDITLLSRQPLLILSPAFAIFLFVLAVRLLSDGLQKGRRN
ncbi:MAG TPA: ABC transporter permease [Pyrinomonadaceae bacterium]|nr:ABC transporter permease [Pyrinomonadaceae bacterium]